MITPHMIDQVLGQSKIGDPGDGEQHDLMDNLVDQMVESKEGQQFCNWFLEFVEKTVKQHSADCTCRLRAVAVLLAMGYGLRQLEERQRIQ